MATQHGYIFVICLTLVQPFAEYGSNLKPLARAISTGKFRSVGNHLIELSSVHSTTGLDKDIFPVPRDRFRSMRPVV